MENNNKIKTFDSLSKWFLWFAGFLIVFSFFAPNIFIRETICGIDFTDSGNIGNTIGGIMGPFIALAGIVLTFLAFYVQLKANERLSMEIEQQKIQFKKNQIENQFYEMLKFHKENVNELTITLFEVDFNVDDSLCGKKTFQKLEGRKIFPYLRNELEILYQLNKKIYADENPDLWIQKSYYAFFYGMESVTDKKEKEILLKIQHAINENNQPLFNNILEKDEIKGQFFRYDHFRGYFNSFEFYYRYLYRTVKFIVNQEEEVINYSEKRNYLRLLRAQLSNIEQVMLFYNWKSDIGNNWENTENKFFTDYRMIHNIDDTLLIDDFKLTKIFTNLNYQKERDNDTLFEFQHNKLNN